MKKSELIKWLKLYNDDLPVAVDTSNGLFEPTAIKKDGDVLVLYIPYDLTGEELMYHNVTNVIVANEGSSNNKQKDNERINRTRKMVSKRLCRCTAARNV